MGRVDKYRRIRITRKRYFLSAVIFISILIAGISTADYTINSLIGPDSGLKIVGVSHDGDMLRLVFMNQKLELDLKYVKSDYERLCEFIDGLF